MLEPKATDITDHSHAGYLSFDLSSDQFQKHIGRGIELLYRHSVRVPLAWTLQLNEYRNV